MTDRNAPAGVRDEDAFDVGRMAGWLRTAAPEQVGSETDPEVHQFTGGASNLTYLLTYPTRQFILRRPPSGTKPRGAHDMKREHDLQKTLKPAFDQVPAMIALCQDHSIMGCDFYVMERVDGLILRRELPDGMDLDPATTRAMAFAAVDTLVRLHQVDVDATGLAKFGKGDYVRRQVEGWSGRHRKARTHGLRHGTGSMESIMRWLVAHQPADSGRCLVHNDFRFDNLVLDVADPTTVKAVLDWELATVGDPLMDMGCTLSYWSQVDDDPVFQKIRRQPSNAPGMPTRDELWDYYLAHKGISLPAEQRLFYEVFGLFRLAVIGQQIWLRYAKGQTTNPAYKEFRLLVLYLDARCRTLITANAWRTRTRRGLLFS